MNPVEGIRLTPLRTDGAAPWLAPWLRDDFDYAVVDHVLDISPGAEPDRDRAHAVVTLLRGLVDGPARWDVATSKGPAPWAAADVSPGSAADGERPRAGLRAVLVGPGAAAAPATPEGALRTCAAVLVCSDGWDDAVVGAPDLRAAAARLGAHVDTDSIAASDLTGPRGGSRTRPSRRRLALAAIGAAAVVGAVVFALTRPDPAPDAPPAATPSTAPASVGPGLFLPTSSRFPGGRTGPAVSFDRLTGTVTLFGGGRLGATSPNDLFPRDTWSWDLNGWRRIPTAVTPPGTSYPAFAYDESTGAAILFGGIPPLGGSGSSTWQWNGLSWRGLHPRDHPAPGVFAAAAYDQARRAVLLVTVCCQTATAGTRSTLQTWEWRAGDWHRLPAPNAPTLTRAPLITYDTARGELLLLTQGSSPETNDTDQVTATSALWAFDGARWRHLATPHSPPYDPIRDRLGYDPASRSVVLFQGGDLHTYLWNGTAWRPLAAAGGPLYPGALTVDATAGKVLLFGGQVPSDDLSSVWTLQAGRWKLLSGR